MGQRHVVRAELYDPPEDDSSPESHPNIILTPMLRNWQVRSIILFCEQAKAKMSEMEQKMGLPIIHPA
jgi:hypothetical protein